MEFLDFITDYFIVFFISIASIIFMSNSKNHFTKSVKKSSLVFFILIIIYIIVTMLERYHEISTDKFNYGRVIFSMLGYMIMPIITLIPLFSFREYKKPFYRFIWIPIIINILIYQLMLYTKIVVWFDENNIFQRGPLGFTLFVVVGIYILLYFYVVAKKIIEKNYRDGLTILFLILSVVAAGVFDVIFVKGFMLDALAVSYLLYYLHMNMLYAKKYEEMLVESQKTELMISQIQPHFMYNILSSIYYLCDHDAKKAKEAINSFSTYLRSNLDAIRGSNIVAFSNELSYCKNYLYLEKIRFDNELNIVYNIETMDFDLPKFTLQPLVENVVKHGISQKEGGGVIEIYVLDKGDYVIVGVKDDGVGFDQLEEKNDGKSHTGLANIKSRVYDYCQSDVVIESTKGEGSHVYFSIKKSIIPKNS